MDSGPGSSVEVGIVSLKEPDPTSSRVTFGGGVGGGVSGGVGVGVGGGVSIGLGGGVGGGVVPHIHLLLGGR